QGPLCLKTALAQPVGVENCPSRVRYVIDGVDDAAPLQFVSMALFGKNIVRRTGDHLCSQLGNSFVINYCAQGIGRKYIDILFVDIVRSHLRYLKLCDGCINLLRIHVCYDDLSPFLNQHAERLAAYCSETLERDFAAF